MQEILNQGHFKAYLDATDTLPIIDPRLFHADISSGPIESRSLHAYLEAHHHLLQEFLSNLDLRYTFLEIQLRSLNIIDSKMITRDLLKLYDKKVIACIRADLDPRQLKLSAQEQNYLIIAQYLKNILTYLLSIFSYQERHSTAPSTTPSEVEVSNQMSQDPLFQAASFWARTHPIELEQISMVSHSSLDRRTNRPVLLMGQREVPIYTASQSPSKGTVAVYQTAKHAKASESRDSANAGYNRQRLATALHTYEKLTAILADISRDDLSQLLTRDQEKTTKFLREFNPDVQALFLAETLRTLAYEIYHLLPFADMEALRQIRQAIFTTLIPKEEIRVKAVQKHLSRPSLEKLDVILFVKNIQTYLEELVPYLLYWITGNSSLIRTKHLAALSQTSRVKETPSGKDTVKGKQEGKKIHLAHTFGPQAVLQVLASS